MFYRGATFVKTKTNKSPRKNPLARKIESTQELLGFRAEYIQTNIQTKRQLPLHTQQSSPIGELCCVWIGLS